MQMLATIPSVIVLILGARMLRPGFGYEPPPVPAKDQVKGADFLPRVMKGYRVLITIYIGAFYELTLLEVGALIVKAKIMLPTFLQPIQTTISRGLADICKTDSSNIHVYTPQANFPP